MTRAVTQNRLFTETNAHGNTFIQTCFGRTPSNTRHLPYAVTLFAGQSNASPIWLSRIAPVLAGTLKNWKSNNIPMLCIIAHDSLIEFKIQIKIMSQAISVSTTQHVNPLALAATAAVFSSGGCMLKWAKLNSTSLILIILHCGIK